MHAEVLINGKLAGWLTHDSKSDIYGFDYSQEWLNNPKRFPISPLLPLDATNQPGQEEQSRRVRHFFENLLPEGRFLDEASLANSLSKSNIFGLINAVGKETSGAISVGLSNDEDRLRELSKNELSERIRARPEEPFSIWDGKVRLSIAGFQDKLSVLTLNDRWYFPEGKKFASTHILKPEPVAASLRGMTSNEFFCMRLAKRIGLPVSEVELIRIPEPVLVITRFDRILKKNGCERLHIIDGCQALGLPPAHKYERIYGSGEDVKNIREGANFPSLFDLANKCTTPVKQRINLLRWALFQVLIGNVDAHAKNMSFMVNESGFTMAPFYDLVSGMSFPDDRLDKNYAMAIGDAFSFEEISPYEWANFAHECGLPKRLVAKTVELDATNILRVLGDTYLEVINGGADEQHLSRVIDTIRTQSEKQVSMSKEILEIDDEFFAPSRR
jgi:serine/threonine-protein kinase HipA